MSPEFILDRSHPNSNIHGMVGKKGEANCQTQEGSLCTGCCYAIRMNNFKSDKLISVFKPEATQCEAQIPGEGCSHILSGQEEKRYESCNTYHCSTDLAAIKDPKTPQQQKDRAQLKLAWANLASCTVGEITVEQMHDNNYFVDEFSPRR